MTPDHEDLSRRHGPYVATLWLRCRGRFVTWADVRDRCGFSDNEVAVSWRALVNLGLAEGDLTRGGTGMVFEHR